MLLVASILLPLLKLSGILNLSWFWAVMPAAYLALRFMIMVYVERRNTKWSSK